VPSRTASIPTGGARANGRDVDVDARWKKRAVESRAREDAIVVVEV
jgi:hypothetical protein|tara:strand:- start:4992 stop:5129 length:138 start_codon:yes stop_codon:yes gene_type:complete